MLAGSTRVLIGVMVWIWISGLVPGHAQVIRSGDRSCQAVALTFDLCPVRKGSGYDQALVQLLVERHIPATFFMSGRWMASHETEVQALMGVPFFDLGTHGQVHAHLPLLDEEHQRIEIERAAAMLETAYHRPTLLFRPPYGEYDDTTVELVRSLGLRLILWSVVSGDPDPGLTREAIEERLARSVRGGSIIVFHANGKGRHTQAVVDSLTTDLLPSRGLKAVTVTELLDHCPVGGRR